MDIKAHDEWLLDLWKSTVDKRDTIYILGDLTFLKSENARHLLEKLPGQKFLIEGNHDGSIRAYKNYFKEVYQIKEMRFKPTAAPFLKEELGVVMCHYPMLTRNKKPYGTLMLHGHSHGKLDDHNAQSMCKLPLLSENIFAHFFLTDIDSSSYTFHSTPTTP